MNKNKRAKILSPLIVVPLSYIGATIINGSHPETANDFIETILFIIIVSLPIGYAGLFCIVLPTEWALKKINYTSTFNLTFLGSVYGGILFTVLDYLFVPGHDKYELSQVIFVFPMGFILGLAVTLSYALISGITKQI